MSISLDKVDKLMTFSMEILFYSPLRHWQYNILFAHIKNPAWWRAGVDNVKCMKLIKLYIVKYISSVVSNK